METMFYVALIEERHESGHPKKVSIVEGGFFSEEDAKGAIGESGLLDLMVVETTVALTPGDVITMAEVH